MAHIDEVLKIFDRMGWIYGTEDGSDKLVTRFLDSHGEVMLVLQAAVDTIEITALGIASVTKDMMSMALRGIGEGARLFRWARDPDDGGVWVRTAIPSGCGDDFAVLVIKTIDDLMVAIDRFRSTLLTATASAPRTSPTPSLVGGLRRIVALSTADELALFQFVDAPLENIPQLLEGHPGLLTATAEDKLRRMIDDQIDESARLRVAERRVLLNRCRQLGIDRVFALRANPELPRDDRPTAS